MDSKRRIKRALDQGQRDILKMGHRLKRCQRFKVLLLCLLCMCSKMLHINAVSPLFNYQNSLTDMCVFKLFKCPRHGDVHWYCVDPCNDVKAGRPCPSPVQSGGPYPCGDLLCRNCGGKWFVSTLLALMRHNNLL